MTPYKVDYEAPHKCLFSGFEELKKAKKHGQSTITTIDTKHGAVVERHLLKVEVTACRHDGASWKEAESMGKWLADCVTGTLYDIKTGKCLSSDQMWVRV